MGISRVVELRNALLSSRFKLVSLIMVSAVNCRSRTGAPSAFRWQVSIVVYLCDWYFVQLEDVQFECEMLSTEHVSDVANNTHNMSRIIYVIISMTCVHSCVFIRRVFY